jgi:hypothetical protein
MAVSIERPSTETKLVVCTSLLPINNGHLRDRVLVFDKVSWSDTPVFHNTLGVGSSPTSSTTQSPAAEQLQRDLNSSPPYQDSYAAFWQAPVELKFFRI